jgi:uncharacterized membrane protein
MPPWRIHRRDWWGSLTVFIISAFGYLTFRPAYPFTTDEAHFALNVAYPHPPVLRFIMGLTQAVFGHTPGVIILPMSLIGALCVALAFFIASGFQKKHLAILAASFVGLMPFDIRYAQSGRLVFGFVFAAILTAVGVMVVTEAQDRWKNLGYAVLSVGVILSVWTEFQGILIAGATGIFCIGYLARKERWKSLSWFSRICLGFAAAHVLLFVLYVIGQPLTVGNFFIISTRGIQDAHAQFFSRFSPAITSELFTLLFLLITSTVIAFRRQTFVAFACWNALLGGLLFPLFLNDPEVYYQPYVIIPMVLSLLIIVFPLANKRMFAIFSVAFVLCAFVSFSLLKERGTDALMNVTQMLSRRVPSSDVVTTIGPFGFEWDYMSPNIVRKLPTDAALRHQGSCWTLVEDRYHESEDEKQWIASLRLDQSIDGYSLYSDPACGGK